MSALQVVAGIIEDEQGLILLAQRPTGKKMSGYWEFPGGKIEPGELAPEALKRELHEELELEVSIGRFMGIYKYNYEWGPIHLHIYLVRALTAPKRTDQVHVFKWINPAKVKASDLVPADIVPFEQYREQIIG